MTTQIYPPKNPIFERLNLGCQCFLFISRCLRDNYFDIIWRYHAPKRPSPHHYGLPKNQFFERLNLGCQFFFVFFWYQEMFKKQIFWDSLGVPSRRKPKWTLQSRDMEAEAGSGGSVKFFVWKRKWKLKTVKRYRFRFHFGHSYQTLNLNVVQFLVKYATKSECFINHHLQRNIFKGLWFTQIQGSLHNYQLKNEPWRYLTHFLNYKCSKILYFSSKIKRLFQKYF